MPLNPNLQSTWLQPRAFQLLVLTRSPRAPGPRGGPSDNSPGLRPPPEALDVTLGTRSKGPQPRRGDRILPQRSRNPLAHLVRRGRGTGGLTQPTRKQFHFRHQQTRKTRENNPRTPKRSAFRLKNAHLSFIRGIPCKPHELNGKLLGFKKLISMNFWVKYLENRNQLDEDFASIRNHLDQHFALPGLYKCEHFEAFPAYSGLQKNRPPATIN